MKRAGWTMAGLLAAAVVMAADDPVALLEKAVKRNYQDLELDVHLVKTSKSGRERPMDLVVKIKDDGKVKKTLAEFTAPDEVKGMKSLSWDASGAGQESERWFQLAGMDWVKCRGKACSNLEDQFGFTMDIFAVKLDHAVHTLKGEETVDGAACWKIESKLKDPSEREDPDIITWIDKEKFAARKIEAYDKDGRLSQTSSFTKFKMLGDHWWEVEGQLTKVQSGKKLTFAITDSKINTGVADDVFAKPQKFKLEEDKK